MRSGYSTFAFDKKSARSFDADGRMRVKNCILSTAEINPYHGSEIPGAEAQGWKPSTVYELYRDPEELEKAAKTFEGVPLLIKHIPQTAEMPRKEYIGGSVHSITFDGKHLRGDLLVMDGVAIELIESGELADLSCGYRYELVPKSGTVDGQSYDGIMTKIEGNHVALVDDGRASGAHVADSAFVPNTPEPTTNPGAKKMAFPEKDGQSAPTPEAKTPGGDPTTMMNPDAAASAPSEGAGSVAGEQNEESNMAAIGQALKHIAMLLENIHGKIGGDTAGADNMGAMDEDKEEISQDPDVGMDMDLEPATKEITLTSGAMDEDDGTGNSPMPKQAPQEGTTARGGMTPTGAMDAKTVKRSIEQAVLNERTRAANVAEAQREVRSILGDVYGMDNAGAIYREALAHVGVDVAGIAKGSEKAAWQAFKAVRGAAVNATAGRVRTEMAMDSKEVESNQSAILAHLNKISVKG